jgi:hypothetical protein
MPLGSERSSGSRVRFPVRTTRFMFVDAMRRSYSLLCVSLVDGSMAVERVYEGVRAVWAESAGK